MSDQQPSKTPRTDAQVANTNQPMGVANLANFARQLETELSTANAEVERLQAELNEMRRFANINNEHAHTFELQRDALLANSKALAEDLKLESEHYASLEAHNKLMEQFK